MERALQRGRSCAGPIPGRDGGARRRVARLFVLLFWLIAGNGTRALELSNDRTVTPGEAIAYLMLNCVYSGTWPDDVDPQRTRQLSIGILGADPVGLDLEAVVNAAKRTWYSGGQVEILHSNDPAALLSSQIVFLGITDAQQLESAIAALHARPILLIGSTPGFAAMGGHVEARIERERLRYEVNLDRLEESGIKLHSKLLIRAQAFIRHGVREMNGAFVEPGR